MTVEEVRGSLDSTDNGAVKNSIRNCLTVFQNDPKLEGAIRYNILTERIDIVKPLWWSKPTTTLNDTDLNYLMLYLEDQYTLTSEKKIQKAISIVADCNKYHPIRDYLNGLEWDGTERIRCALPHFLGAEESEFTYECLRLFMLGAISRVFKPGSKFETMLCLVGGQGAGKSTFFRLLAIKDEWFSDDLKRIDDDNVYRKMQGHWIIEMSEMIATANAKSIDTFNTGESRGREVSHSLNYQKLGKDLATVDELAVLDGGKCILQLRGVRPFLSDKYDITKHPNYKYLSDADKRNEFDIERFLSRRLKPKPDEVYDVYDIDASAMDAGETAGG